MGKAIIIGFNSEEERDSDHTDPNLSIKHKDNSNKWLDPRRFKINIKDKYHSESHGFKLINK